MTIANFKQADGSDHIVQNLFRNAAGSQVSVSNNVKDSGGTPYTVFGTLLITTTPANQGQIFIPLDVIDLSSRIFTAEDDRTFTA